MTNAFQEQQSQEKQNARDEALNFLVGGLTKVSENIEKIKREVRNVRQDLRNEGKLRPLREEGEVSESSSGTQGTPSTTQK